MKKISIATLFISLGLLLVACSQEQQKEHEHSSHSHSEKKAKIHTVKPQEKCPIKGGELDKKVYTDYKGQRIYYCCPGCDKTFLKNPEKYLKQMEADGITPAKLQSECPVSGDEIDKDIYSKTQAGKIYVCCKKCKSKVDTSPDKYLTILKNQNIVIGATQEKHSDQKKIDHSNHKH